MNKIVGRAFGIILPLCMLSLLISGAIISLANDMFAFVKRDKEIIFNISEDSTIEEISELFSKGGLIRNPFMFKAYVKSKDKVESIESFSGEITLNSSMSYREILLSLI